MSTEDEAHYLRNISTLKNLNATKYCDLGIGFGRIALELKKSNKNVMGVEHPGVPPENYVWAKEHNIDVHLSDFFAEEMKKLPTDIDCFYLVHCIAHFRFPPHELFEVLYDKLPVGGRFYLSTVNASSLTNVMKLFRGNSVTEKVNKVPSWSKPGGSIMTPWNKSGRPHIWDDWMHVKEYNLNELTTIFKEEGFEIEESYHQNFHVHWKKSIMCKFWPHLSDECVVIGKKV